jgi:hypothetical protein
MVGRTVYVPLLPRDLAVLLAWIIAPVKNIDAPMLTRVWQELEYDVDVCTHRKSLVVKKKTFHFSCGCEQFH